MDLYPFDPANGPAVPDLPPISIGVLSVGLTDLLDRASGLPLPRHVIISEPQQEFALQFAPVPDSAQVITSWAMRFGGVLQTHTCEPEPGAPHKHIKFTFDFYGITVEAYTFIPLPRQENRS